MVREEGRVGVEGGRREDGDLICFCVWVGGIPWSGDGAVRIAPLDPLMPHA